MSKKTTRTSLGFDPKIQNRKSKSGPADQNREGWSRREFLTNLGLAGTGALLGLRSNSLAAEPPPETVRLRVVRADTICFAPQYMAEDLLKREGFTKLQYVKTVPGGSGKAVASGEADITMQFSAPNIIGIERGDPLIFLAGIHVGCFEVFGTDRVRGIPDLKGKTVAVFGMGSPTHVFLSIMAANVGLDPRRDINWVTHPPADSVRLLAEGKIDALLLFPPLPQELRAKKIGHVVVNSMMDRPWSQYFCCMVIGNRDFVRKNPVATKRALRAILKMTDFVAREPERAARFLLDNGYTKNYEYALQTMKEMTMAYDHWREYDPEDTVRFWALRLHEAGMINSSPQKIIAQGTDWRFLKELKKELKA
jgi:NitT/TauT family transport system substrate-binding protein